MAVGQELPLEQDVSCTVAEVRFDKVRLGFNALREMSVHRKEVYDAIRR